MKKQAILVQPVAQEYVAAIQRNIEAHTPWAKHYDLFFAPEREMEKELWGIPVKSFRAADLIESAAKSFKVEHGLSGRSKRAKGAEAKPLREALEILQKAARQLDRELTAKLRRRPDFNRSPRSIVSPAPTSK